MTAPTAPFAERVRRRAEYVTLRILYATFRRLPLKVAYAVAEVMFVIFYLVSRYRHRALSSLEIAFGNEMAASDRKALFWRSVRYQAWFFLDALLAPSLLMRRRHWKDLDMSEMERARERHDENHSGLGAVLVSAHLGTPEIVSLASARDFWPHMGVARKLDNRLIWEWIVAQREAFRRPTVDRSGILRPALRHLRSGRSVAMLNDQNAGPDGEFVPFFGRLASTHVGAAALAVHTGAPLYVIHCIRSRPRSLSVRVTVSGPHFADPDAARPAEIHRLTALFTAEIEAMTRRHPEQALWAHRRWKTRPPEESETP